MTKKYTLSVFTTFLVATLLLLSACQSSRSADMADKDTVDTTTITNFEECAAAHYPVMESFPRQCLDGQGVLHVEIVEPIVRDDQEPLPETPQSQNDSFGAGPNESDDVTFCTMDAFQCPDGSWVGRSGPDCEFVCE